MNKKIIITAIFIGVLSFLLLGGQVLAAPTVAAVTFPDDVVAGITQQDETELMAVVPDGVVDGGIMVTTSTGTSNQAPFVVGTPFTPDESGIGTTWAVSVTGEIVTNTTWSENTLVTGDITVPSGITLTIEAGVTVFFATNSDDQAAGLWTDKAEIQVRGALVAEGTAQNPVYFTSDAASPAVEDWGGIVIRKNSTTSSLDYCLIQYATYGVYFYDVKEGAGNLSGVISHSTFQSNTVGIRTLERPGNGGTSGTLFTSPQIQHSLFKDNTDQGVAFIATSGAKAAHNTAILQDNIFQNNGTGVLVSGRTWGATIRVSPQIVNNVFIDNTLHNLHIKSSQPYDSGTSVVEPLVENNLFTTTANNIYLELERSVVISPTIRYNTIASAAYGIRINDIGTTGVLAPDIHHNIFYDFDEYAIFNDTNRTIIAEQNYWGATSAEWAMGASGMITGTGTVSTTNHLDAASPPILTYASPGIAQAGDSVKLYGANFGVNTLPIANDDNSYSTYRNASLSISAPGVLNNDVDADGDALTAVLDSGVSHGTLTLNPDGSFIYEPDAGFVGDDSFTYHANDGLDDSNTVTVSIDVINSTPVAGADAYTVISGGLLTVSSPGILANDSDANGDALTAVLDSDVSHGTLTLNPDGSFTYEPDAGFVGDDNFTYHTNDGLDDSNTVTVSITVDEQAGYMLFLPIIKADKE